jgi:hypothetical protein
MKTIAVVNQYYPPDKASTGWLAQELVEELRAALPDWRVRVIATDATYRGGVEGDNAKEETDIIRLPSGNRLDNKLRRLIGSLQEGRRLANVATREADVVISMTNPPLVNIWMGHYARKRGRKYVEWTLDLFPEAFSSAGLISEKNPIYRYFLKRYSRNFPDFNLFLGPMQRDFVMGKHRKVGESAIVTCGIKRYQANGEPAWRMEHADKIVLGYIGNMGEAHSSDSLIRLVERADPERFRFLFSMYGAKVERVREALGNHPAVIWTEGLPDGDLPWLDAQIVSLLPEWTHVCVPSKGVSAICAGNPMVYIGVEQADIYQFFKEASWLVREDGAVMDSDIDRVLAELRNSELLKAKKAATAVHTGEQEAAYRKGIDDLVRWLTTDKK